MAKKPTPLTLLISKLPKPLQNKYIIALIIFFIMIVLVSRVNPWEQYQLRNTKAELKQKKAFYQRKINEVKAEKLDNEKNIEKFAREHYYMKKANEDVFVIKDE